VTSARERGGAAVSRADLVGAVLARAAKKTPRTRGSDGPFRGAKGQSTYLFGFMNRRSLRARSVRFAVGRAACVPQPFRREHAEGAGGGFGSFSRRCLARARRISRLTRWSERSPQWVVVTKAELGGPIDRSASTEPRNLEYLLVSNDLHRSIRALGLHLHAKFPKETSSWFAPRWRSGNAEVVVRPQATKTTCITALRRSFFQLA
jgi:hypothetical protein